MSKKNYPEWGLFGTVTENATPQSTEQENTIDQLPKETNGGAQVDLVIECKGIKVTTNEKDTPDQIAAAIRTVHELAERDVKAHKPEFINCDHVLQPFIEQAMSNVRVTGFENENVKRIWQELIRISNDADESPAIVQGYVAGKGIEYWGARYEKTDGRETDFFSREAFAQLFRRQREHHAKARQTTSKHAS